MATLRLGPSGSEINLPKLQWIGSPPSLPVSPEKQISERQMIDGSFRYGFYGKKRVWDLEWGYMSKADLDSIETLQDENQTLRFQNNHEDATWYDVVFLRFDYEPVRSDIRQLGYYKVRIVLKEV